LKEVSLVLLPWVKLSKTRVLFRVCEGYQSGFAPQCLD
jgi:hypothetical protein